MYTFYLPSGLRVSTHELTSVRESRIVVRDPLMVDGDIVGKKKKKGGAEFEDEIIQSSC